MYIVPQIYEVLEIDGAKYFKMEPDEAWMPVPRCRLCRWWDADDAEPVDATDTGICRSDAVRRDVEQISTVADFGCVHWAPKP